MNILTQVTKSLVHRLARHYKHRPKKNRLFLIGASIILLLALIPTLYLSFFKVRSAAAAWFDDEWAHRKKITFGNNGSSTTNKKVKFDIDTTTLITAGQLQSDCGDIRFTDANGKILRYYLDSSGGACNTSSTDFYVEVETIYVGDTVLYMYYGNPNAANGTEASQLSLDTFTPTSGPTIGSEENAPSPTAYWKLDEGVDNSCSGGSNDVCDSGNSKKDGSLSGAVWKTESECVMGKCLFFDGTNDVVTFSGTISNIKTVSFWVKAATTTEQFIDLNGTASLSASSGTVAATNFTSPTIYIDGKVGSTINANKWHYVTVTTSTGISASAIKIGQISTNYGQIVIDEIKLYSTERSANQVQTDFVKGAASAGSSAVVGLQDQSFLTQGLVGYWKMDETSWNGTSGEVKDSSGNSGNGTRAGDATTTSSGKYGYGGSFDGTGDYVDVTMSNNFKNTSEFTVGGWIYMDTDDSTSHIISTYDYDSSSNEHGFIFGRHFGGLGLRLFRGSQNNYITLSSLPSTGTWHHVVAVFREGIGVKLYVDGVEASQSVSDSTGTPTYTVTYDYTAESGDSPNLRIGERSDTTGYAFDGKMDDLRFYNRALSASEVTKVYNYGAAPVGYWNFEEGSGSTALDRSGNGLNGTVTGSPSWTGGKYGGAITFDGADDVVTVADNSLLDIAGAVSVEGWVKASAQASITTDAAGATACSTTGTTCTHSNFALGYGSGRNRLVVAGVSTELGGDVTNVTFNGVAGTEITEVDTDDGNGTLSMWYWLDSSLPSSSGSYNIVATTSSLTDRVVGVQSFINVKQSAPDASNTNKTNSGTSISQSVTTVTNDSIVVDAVMNGTNESFTATNSITEQYDVSSSGTSSRGAGGYKFVTTAASTTGGYSGSATTRFAYIIAAWSPAENVIISKGADAYQLTYDVNTTLKGYLNTSNTISSTLDSSWHHVAYTYDGATQKIYKDGILVSSNSVATTISANSTSLSIGQTFSGIIDEVRIYNYARSPGQITESLNADHPLGGSPIGSPTAYWALDEQQGQVVNSRTNSYTAVLGLNTGTGTIDPLWKSAADCKINGCLYFEGDDFVTVSDTAALRPSTITISAWVKLTAASGFQRIVTKGWTNNGSYIIYTSGSNVVFGMYNSSGTRFDASYSGAITAGQWHHVAATFDGTTMKVYVDGRQGGTTATVSGSGFLSDTTDLFLSHSTNDRLTGYIDEVKMYNTALTQEQVLIDMNANASQNISTGTRLESAQLSDGSGNAPTAYWNFNENTGSSANDTSGNSNTGTFAGNTTWTSGKYSSGALFDGSGDYIDIANESNFDFDKDNSFTVGFWLKPDTSNTAVQSVIAKMVNSSPFTGWSIGTNTSSTGGNTAGELNFQLNNTWFTSGQFVSASVATSMNDGNWHHYTVSYDGSGSSSVIKIYEDGILLTTSTQTKPTSSALNSTAVTIGARSTGTVPYDGAIDDVKIYNYARTQAQVAYDYNRGGPVAWYKFDECQGTSAYDSSGNSLNGTISPTSSGNTSAGNCTSGSSTEMWANGATGKFNGSLDFDGTDDYVSVTHSSKLNLSGTGGTIAAWIKPSAQDEQFTAIVDKGSGDIDLTRTYAFYVSGSSATDRKLRLVFQNTGVETSSNAWTEGEWQHVAVTWDGTDAKFYRNGVLIHSAAQPAVTYTTNSTDLSIGRLNVSNDREYDGQMDDVRIYNYALSAAQMRQLMTQGAATRYGPSSGSP